MDSVRGATKELNWDSMNAESTDTQGLTSFDSDGFTLGTTSDTGYNESTSDFASYNWLEGATYGFDIVSYVGDRTTPRAVAHSLGVKPDVMIIKNRDEALNSWAVWHKDLSSLRCLFLDTSGSENNYPGYWGSTEPTTSNFYVGDAGTTNETGDNIIAYLFKGIEGFSKFGSYTGNGNNDGPFVYCGFRPALIIVKNTVTNAYRWAAKDNKRDAYNVATLYLAPNDAQVEGAAYEMDFLSNGFKVRTNSVTVNASGEVNVFMAWAEQPFKYSNAR